VPAREKDGFVLEGDVEVKKNLGSFLGLVEG
jgi:hypothetical protein